MWAAPRLLEVRNQRQAMRGGAKIRPQGERAKQESGGPDGVDSEHEKSERKDTSPWSNHIAAAHNDSMLIIKFYCAHK
jgi:hypothetical protein